MSVHPGQSRRSLSGSLRRLDAGIVLSNTGIDPRDVCHHFLHCGGSVFEAPREAANDKILQLLRDLLARYFRRAAWILVEDLVEEINAAGGSVDMPAG